MLATTYIAGNDYPAGIGRHAPVGNVIGSTISSRASLVERTASSLRRTRRTQRAGTALTALVGEFAAVRRQIRQLRRDVAESRAELRRPAADADEWGAS